MGYIHGNGSDEEQKRNEPNWLERKNASFDELIELAEVTNKSLVIAVTALDLFCSSVTEMRKYAAEAKLKIDELVLAANSPTLKANLAKLETKDAKTN